VKSYIVKDLMVPLDEYATVDDDATVFEAVATLEKLQQAQRTYRHRAILVLDKNKKVIGKLSMIDLIKTLEPKYFDMQDRNGGAGALSFGFSKKFMKSMMEQFKLLDGALDNICKKAGESKANRFMTTPTEYDYVASDASLNEAVHQLVLGHHQSLLVTDSTGDIIGILRLTDVFTLIYQRMQECNFD
jgi:CBS domain-containing protein